MRDDEFERLLQESTDEPEEDMLGSDAELADFASIVSGRHTPIAEGILPPLLLVMDETESDSANMHDRIPDNPFGSPGNEPLAHLTPEQNRELNLLQPEALAVVLDMLVNGDEQDHSAGSNLLSLLSGYPSEVTDGHVLRQMLADPNQRSLASRILAHPYTDQRHQLARLCAAGNFPAAQQIQQMLESGNRNQRAGAELFLDSFASDGVNRDGRLSSESTNRLATMLASNDPDEAALAARILSTVRPDDPTATASYSNSVEQLVRLLERRNADGSPDRGPFRTVMSMLDGSLQYRARASQLLDMLATGGQDGNDANALLALMGTVDGARQANMIFGLPRELRATFLSLPEQERQTVETILADRRELGLSLLTDIRGVRPFESGRAPLTADQVEEDTRSLLSMLSSEDNHTRSLAQRILTSASDARSRHNFLSVLRSDGEDTLRPQEQATLERMLTTPAEHRTAQRLLSELDSPGQLGYLLRTLNDPETQADGRRLVDMVETSPAQARTVLGLLMSSDTDYNRVGQQLLRNLEGSAGHIVSPQSIRASEILATGETPGQIRALLQLSEEEPDAYGRILGLLRTPVDDQDAFLIIGATRNLLNALGSGNEQAERVARWFNDHGTENDTRALVALGELFGRSNGSEIAARFMDRLDGPDPATTITAVATAGESLPLLDRMLADYPGGLGNNLLEMLSGDRAQRRAALSVLQLTRGDSLPATTSEYLDRLNNPDTRSDAWSLAASVGDSRQLATLLAMPAGAARSEITRMLQSEDQSLRLGARNLLSLLDSDPRRISGDTGATSAPPVASQILDLLSNPTTRSQAIELLSRTIEPNSTRVLAELILPSRGADGAVIENPRLSSAQWLLSQLANPALSGGLNRAMLRLGNAEQMHELVRLLSSEDPAERATGENLQSYILSDEDTGDFRRGRNALTLLTNRGSRDALLRTLGLLNSDDPGEQALARDLLSSSLPSDPRATTILAELLADGHYRGVSQELTQRLQEDGEPATIETAQTLLELLANPATRADGERLRDMLNSDSRVSAGEAWRELSRRRPARTSLARFRRGK